MFHILSISWHLNLFPDIEITCRQTSNIRRTLVANKIVDHSDVVGASPVGAAPTTPSFLTQHLVSRYSVKTVARQYENRLGVGILLCLILET